MQHGVEAESSVGALGGVKLLDGSESAGESHEKKPVGVMALDDRGEFLETLKTILDEWSGFRWLGAYTEPRPFLSDVGTLSPDVILLDIDMPGRDGIWVLNQLREAKIETPVLMLSVIEDTDSIVRALECGAQGYLVKSSTDQQLIWAIRDLLRGGAPISASIARRVLQRFVGEAPVELSVGLDDAVEDSMEKLTRKELETLELLAAGMKYAEIAQTQGVKTDTVGTHVRHIYEKLKVRNRTEAAMKYFNAKDRAR